MTYQVISNGVIVAENDVQMRGIIRSILTQVEQLVFPVADGMEAINIARRFKAGLVLLDIAMPRLNGLQACREIRTLPNYTDVPIIMLTGYHDEKMVTSARKLGASHFMIKPFRPSALLACLANYLDLPPRSLPAGAALIPRDEANFGSRAVVWKSASRM